MERIGFIGLGNMGKPMAKNLLKAGYSLVVFDVADAPVRELVNMGGIAASNPRSVAAQSDVIILMLPSSPHVETVILGSNGVLEGAKPGSLVIDMSSIAPTVEKRVAENLRAKGVRVLDAPVAGGTIGAQNGTLTIMVGGEKEDLSEALPILEKMGKRIVHVGEIGMGQVAKVCNQVVVGISFCAIAEALILGVKAGADPATLLEVLNSGSAHSWILENKIPPILNGNFEPGFMIDLQHKDLGLALETGKDMHVPLAFTGLAYQAYEAARAQGLGRKDHSAVIRVLEGMANVQVRKGGGDGRK